MATSPSLWDCAITALTPGIHLLWKFLNSNFFTALAGALGGAIAGAIAAQRIASKDAQLESVLDDLRRARSAVVLVTGIMSSATGMKRQFVSPMVKDYKDLSARHQEYLEQAAQQRAKGAKPGQFRFNPELKLFQSPALPIDELEKVIGGAELDFVAWSLFHNLRQATSNLNSILSQRNDIIEGIRTNQFGQDVLAVYLGLHRGDGNVDGRFPEIMAEMPRQIDDILGLSRVLIEHLMQRIRVTAATLGKKAPKISEPDFTRIEHLGVLPDLTEYRDLLSTLKGDVQVGDGMQAPSA